MDFLTFTYEAGPIKIVIWEVLYIIGLVLVLSALLNRWLFQPVLGVLDARAARIDAASGDQDELLADVETKQRQQVERLAAARRGAVEAVEAARAEADAKRAERLAEARAKADERIAAAEALLAEDAAKAEVDLRADAEALSRSIASQVLGREVA